MPDFKKDMASYLEAWRKFKDEKPASYSALAVLPVTGQLAAVADYADAMDRGDSVDGAIAAASFIPGVGLGKAASKLAPATIRLKSKMNAVEKAISPAVKRSKEIGVTADSEQVGELIGKEINKAQQPQTKSQSEMDEFMNAFGGGA